MRHTLRRVAPLAAAAGLSAALAAYASLGLDGEALALALAVCGVAIGLLVVDGLGWWPGLAVAGQALLAFVYIAVLVGAGRELDTGAPAFAAGLLLAGELSALARDADLTRGVAFARRGAALGLLALAAVGAGWLLLVAVALPLPGGTPATLAGVLAAVAIPALLTAARRRAG